MSAVIAVVALAVALAAPIAMYRLSHRSAVVNIAAGAAFVLALAVALGLAVIVVEWLAFG